MGFEGKIHDLAAFRLMKSNFSSRVKWRPAAARRIRLLPKDLIRHNSIDHC